MTTIYKVSYGNQDIEFLDLGVAQDHCVAKGIPVENITSYDKDLTETIPSPFVLTNDFSTPTRLQTTFGTLGKFLQIKKEPTVKGELREVKYYLEAPLNPSTGLPIYTSLAVVERNTWQYYTDASTTPKTVFPLIRLTSFDFYLQNGEIGYTWDTIKTYDLAFLADIQAAINQRHENIIAEAIQYLKQFLTLEQLGYLQVIFGSEISTYKLGIGAPLVAAISGSVLPFLTPDIKQGLCGTSEDPTLGILNY